ncbi:Malate dehydrogenase, mitochondrial [Komagataella phaffii CBS 7435]|uniref:Malate dehydrogenase n=2 Tax=Komagataella phaffii TaxID=460519 RepID=C4R024_KOMPG|nr:Mitochondrial malate dehydrogenase, catalyzes interconversion of malate and oxaloacetate [Komagataella phaffii GS115]AOA62090.1 GQ67_00266T0 [Komagataella phaffii]KAI0462746.1 Malate dehydrogenase, cytoplasmic [Komagataella kurtzmanii]CAH2448651.1 Malate dehydrogenase, mitochondrial [Komagataella phaffii CBS 7435]AOA67754.1 GQ68_01123T0 [Komagataella phaffii GS115]CAY68848.1 Mitochondrial malate dehydrogenase, catalyzes interconversion of malate and oxaloacetate [Komagataella phaffii GS115]
MLSTIAKRQFSSSASTAYKVAVLGAAGGIGQPLSLLMKLNHKVTDLALYDIRLAPGVAADVSHIPTNSTVTGYTPEDNGLEKTLTGADLVIIPAGVPRKPGMTRDDLFNTNASIVRDLAKAVGDYSPSAAVAIISNPVNSTVPIVAEVLKSKGVYNPKKLFGVTTLDVLRASRFLSQVQGTNPASEPVTVVGGHSGVTIVPLLSQSKHKDLPKDTYDALVHRIQFGGDEVVKAKDGAGSATLSMAQAGARFASSVLNGLAGENDVVEPSFVDSPLFKDEGIEFFSSKVTLGPEGVKTIHGLGELSAAEEEMITTAKETLAKNIAKGQEFVKQNP